jgi:hypothetical protein
MANVATVHRADYDPDAVPVSGADIIPIIGAHQCTDPVTFCWAYLHTNTRSNWSSHVCLHWTTHRDADSHTHTITFSGPFTIANCFSVTRPIRPTNPFTYRPAVGDTLC